MREKIILILLLILFPVSTKAYSCSYNDKAALRKYASAVTTSYDYVEENDNVKFSVTFTNLRNDLYIVDKSNGNTYYNNGESELTLNGYEAGSKLKFEIRTTRKECIKTYLTIKYVNLPFYNKYYKDPLCEGKTYSVCSKWQKVTLTHDEFVKTVTEKNKEEKPEETKNEDETIFDKIFAFIFDYYLVIIGAGLVIAFVTRTINNKKNDFDL